MLQTTQEKAEYVLYAYDFNDSNEQERWERIMSSDDADHITSRAENLFQTDRYKKIEIQKKFFDRRKNQRQAQTVKIFEKKAPDNYLMLLGIFSMAMLAFVFFYHSII